MEPKDTNRTPDGRFAPGHTVNAYPEEDMQRFFDLYCKHRAAGKDKQSFSRHGCWAETVEKWVSQSIDPTIHARMRDAEAKGWELWESLMFNVGFGIPTEVNAPTKEDPERRHTIEARNTQPHILIFMMKSKFRTVYGDKAETENTNHSEINVKGSQPFTIVDGQGNQSRLLLAQPTDQTDIEAVANEDEEYQRALAAINAHSGDKTE